MFEEIQYHVLDMHLKCTFGPHAYFESGLKLRIETIRKWTKTLISNAIDFLSGIYDQMLARRFGPLSNYPNMYFWSRFKLRTWTKRTSVMHIIFNKGQYTLKIQHVIPLEILEFQYSIPDTLFWAENWTLSYQDKLTSPITSSLPVHFWLFWTFLNVGN